MRDYTECGKTIPDDKVVLISGFVYIIIRDKECYIENGEYHESEYSIVVKDLDPEYDEPITLADIARDYPNVTKVIHEDYMDGEVFNYGNHDRETWECVGKTMGFV